MTFDHSCEYEQGGQLEIFSVIYYPVCHQDGDLSEHTLFMLPSVFFPQTYFLNLTDTLLT